MGDSNAITAAASGTFYVKVTNNGGGYYDSSNGDLKVAHWSNPACTSATTAAVDSANTIGQSPRSRSATDGLGLISYYDVTNQDLKIPHCLSSTCISASTATLDSVGNVGQYTSIAIAADGLGSPATTTAPTAASRWPTARTPIAGPPRSQHSTGRATRASTPRS